MQPTFNKIAMNRPYHWYKEGWQIAKANYELCLGLAAGLVVVGGVLSQSTVLSMVWGAANVFLYAGVLDIVKKLKGGESVSWKRLGFAFQDVDLRNRLFPLAVVSVVTSLMVSVSMAAMFVLSIALAIFTAFSLPLMVFQNMKFQDTIGVSLRAFGVNFWVIVWGVIFFLGLAIVSFVLLVVPFIFWFLPLTLPVYYLVYEDIFGDKAPSAPSSEAMRQSTF